MRLTKVKDSAVRDGQSSQDLCDSGLNFMGI